MLHLKVHLRFHFKKPEKLQKKMWKGVFDVAAVAPLDGAIKGALLNLKFGSLRVLCIFYNAEQTELLTFSN